MLAAMLLHLRKNSGVSSLTSAGLAEVTPSHASRTLQKRRSGESKRPACRRSMWAGAARTSQNIVKPAGEKGAGRGSWWWLVQDHKTTELVGVCSGWVRWLDDCRAWCGACPGCRQTHPAKDARGAWTAGRRVRTWCAVVAAIQEGRLWRKASHLCSVYTATSMVGVELKALNNAAH